MATPNLVQSNTGSTSASGPTSITPAFTGGSTAGNLLIMVIVVNGTSPSITLPANWLSAKNATNSTMGVAIFYIPGNAGGITSVTVTINAGTGGATWGMLEFSNMPNIGTSAILDAISAVNASTSTTPNTALTTPSAQNGELVLAVAGFAPATVNSQANTQDLQSTLALPASTVGTTNAQGQVYYGASLLNLLSALNVTLNASVLWRANIVRFFANGGQYVDNVYIGGVPGTIWPPTLG